MVILLSQWKNFCKVIKGQFFLILFELQEGKHSQDAEYSSLSIEHLEIFHLKAFHDATLDREEENPVSMWFLAKDVLTHKGKSWRTKLLLVAFVGGKKSFFYEKKRTHSFWPEEKCYMLSFLSYYFLYSHKNMSEIINILLWKSSSIKQELGVFLLKLQKLIFPSREEYALWKAASLLNPPPLHVQKSAKKPATFPHWSPHIQKV